MTPGRFVCLSRRSPDALLLAEGKIGSGWGICRMPLVSLLELTSVRGAQDLAMREVGVPGG
jgi:hypothetical protein